jgi:hypothetical protein
LAKVKLSNQLGGQQGAADPVVCGPPRLHSSSYPVSTTGSARKGGFTVSKLLARQHTGINLPEVLWQVWKYFAIQTADHFRRAALKLLEERKLRETAIKRISASNMAIAAGTSSMKNC